MTFSAPRERARALILEFGWNATAYQLLNPGMELWFSRGGDGVVGYVTHRRMHCAEFSETRFTNVAHEMLEFFRVEMSVGAEAAADIHSERLHLRDRLRDVCGVESAG